MSSKLVSLARVAFLSKATAARSAPAAIVGPLRRIFGDGENIEEEEQQQHEHEQQQRTPDEGTPDERLAAESPATGGIFTAMAARAETAAAGGAPVDGPAARRELRDFQAGYYRRVLAAEPPSDPAVDDPDLSVPVGDEYLYLAQ